MKNMSASAQSRVIGLLGVGFDHQDGYVRITQSEDYQIFMGSSETHQALQELCKKIENKLVASDRILSDCTPEEFMELLWEIC